MSSVQPISEPDYGLKKKYENYIGGHWVAPSDGEYFENISPVNGKPMTMIPRSQAADIELALDAAHEAAPAWGKTSVAERSSILMKIADRMEENLEMLATVETWDNGKSIRETLAADLPLAIDHFRYFATFVGTLLGDFATYLDTNDCDLTTDRVGYRQVPLWLTDDELDSMVMEISRAVQKQTGNKPSPGRRRRVLNTIVMPGDRP